LLTTQQEESAQQSTPPNETLPCAAQLVCSMDASPKPYVPMLYQGFIRSLILTASVSRNTDLASTSCRHVMVPSLLQ
jgi:hypothetical protein